jgi:crotonobetainyl-CoA:carnitine CoA-transferase CaiB-like acyl-CoA transferase
VNVLQGLRVLDTSSSLAGAYSTKLLVDAGAEAVRFRFDDVPRPAWQDSEVLMRYLGASKQRVAGTPSECMEWAIGAELLVEDGLRDRLDLPDLRMRAPHLVVVSLSPFGLTGPWRDRAATEFTLQAWSSSIFQRGTSERPPLQDGGELGEWAAGSFAAIAGLSAYRRATQTGHGEHVDLAVLESVFSIHHPYIYLGELLGGVPFGGGDGRVVDVPSVARAADGYVAFATVTPRQWKDFLGLIERPDLLVDESLVRAPVRYERRAELIAIIESWSSRRSTSDILALAESARVPAVPVTDARSLLELDLVQERELFVDNAYGLSQPRVPYRITGHTPPAFGTVPDEVSATGGPSWRSQGAARVQPIDDPDPDLLPLAGLRVLDLTAFIAGPSGTQVLAALGADVIKVESLKHPDGLRLVTADTTSEFWWERGPVFQIYNRCKRGITLDLTSDDGREALLSLAETCDVLIENFTPRVLGSFGITWELLQARAPRLVLVRQPAFGLTGTWRDRPAFAMTIEAVTGLASVTGYPDGLPTLPRGPSDVISGLHAVFALLCALELRAQSGSGMMVEVPMVDAVLNVAAEAAMVFAASGVMAQRRGNRGRVSPQGVFACRGEERWLALSVGTDEQWVQLCDVLGLPDVGRGWRALGPTGRRDAEDEIESWITLALADRDRDELVEVLARAGVPAAPVLAQREVPALPQIQHRGFFEPVRHPVIGEQPMPGLPFTFASRAGRSWLSDPAPTLGQHNTDVLARELGLCAQRLDGLEESGVVGERPHYA